MLKLPTLILGTLIIYNHAERFDYFCLSSVLPIMQHDNYVLRVIVDLPPVI